VAAPRRTTIAAAALFRRPGRASRDRPGVVAHGRGFPAGAVRRSRLFFVHPILVPCGDVISDDMDSPDNRSAMPSSYTLGVHFAAFIKGLVESGRYNNASKVVRDGLRLLEERERLREVKVAELRRLAEEGRLSGLSDEDGEAVLDRLEAEYRARAERASPR